MFPPVDTKDAAAVAKFVTGKFETLYPGDSPAWIERLLRDVVELFDGRHDDYQAIDLRYHDLEHTLQATVCMALLLQGTRRAPNGPTISRRQFELAIAAVLLHDSGYLKLRSDLSGTGAKYTYCHVLRSCAFAASYLPRLGASETEILGVLGAINCTGPTKEIRGLYFHDSLERFIGCALATADYLGQMASPDYPDELEYLYAEFAESDDYLQVPVAQRPFRCAEDLITRTPAFWRNVVRAKLEEDFQGAYRYLADPHPGGPNAYMDAVDANIVLIEARIAERSRGVR
jgi:hypothetical protein